MFNSKIKVDNQFIVFVVVVVFTQMKFDQEGNVTTFGKGLKRNQL